MVIPNLPQVCWMQHDSFLISWGWSDVQSNGFAVKNNSTNHHFPMKWTRGRFLLLTSVGGLYINGSSVHLSSVKIWEQKMTTGDSLNRSAVKAWAMLCTVCSHWASTVLCFLSVFYPYIGIGNISPSLPSFLLTIIQFNWDSNFLLSKF